MWENRTDEQLAQEADTGLRGQGPVVIIMGRLRDALVKQQKSTNCLTWVILGCTVMLVFLTCVLVVVAVAPQLSLRLNWF